MSDKRRRRRGTSVYRRRTSEPLDDEDSDGFDDDVDEEDWDDEPARPRRRRPAGSRDRKRRGSKGKGLGGLFSGGRKARGRDRDGIDWDAADDEDYDEEASDDLDDEDRSPRRRSRRTKRRTRSRHTLMDLCSPVFGFVAVLPRGDGGIEPSYEQFRNGVLHALNSIREEADENGIEKEDAEEAVYALSLFLDEQVMTSTWSGRETWAPESLGKVLIGEPEGGVNFFSHLDALSDRQIEVKKIFLICVAMGFRGKHAQLDEVQQASRLGEIRRKLIRSIHPKPLDKQEYLFPEGYAAADPIEDEAPTAPRLWMGVSAAVVFLSVLLWVFLFWQAGRIPDPAEKVVEDELSRLEQPGARSPTSSADDDGREGSR